MTSYSLAQAYLNIQKTFFRGRESEIYTLSPLFTMPARDFNKYELNYRLLGKLAAEQLITRRQVLSPPQKLVLENDGLRRWGVSLKKSIVTVKPVSDYGSNPASGIL